MATIYEVSKLAGVSLATVSRVINNTATVREATRERVEKAMRELGYQPNTMAQSLASNRSNSVGVVVSELNGPFYGTLLSEIEKAFRAVGKHVVFAASHSDQAIEQQSIEFLKSRRVDALILHVESVSDEYLAKLNHTDCPVIILNRDVPALEKQCITLNNRLGGYLATHYLLQLGHRDIAYIAGPQWKSDARDRYLGHCDALREAGIEPNPELFYEGDFQETGGTRGFLALQQKAIPFSAVVCGNDEMAAGVIAEAHDQDIDIPEKLSIIGFDNVNFSHYVYPKLTTIDYPIASMGQMAAHWILQHVYQQKMPPLQQLFEPKLVIRDSTTHYDDNCAKNSP